MTYCWWTKSSVIDNDEISRKDPQSIHNPLTIPSIFFSGFHHWLTVRFPCIETDEMPPKEVARRQKLCSRAMRHLQYAHDKLMALRDQGLALPPEKQQLGKFEFFFFFGVFSLTDADFSTSKWPKTLASLEVVFFLLQVWLSGEASRAFQPSKGVTGWIETSELLVASQPWWCGKQRDFGISSGWISTCLGGSHVSWKGHWFESCF